MTTSYCKNATPQILPLYATNGVSGNWLPPTVNTSVAGTSTYVFTGVGQCISSYNLTVTINEPTYPDFPNISITTNFQPTPLLPTTSPNGISGTWIPAVINPNQTDTYTFHRIKDSVLLNQ